MFKLDLAFYYYGGSQHTFIKWINSPQSNPKDVVILAERKEYVLLFACALSVDCIILGTLWCLFIFKHSTFRGTFFRYLIFSIDFIFDMFYATFPLLLIGANNLTFTKAAASVNSESIITFFSTMLPIIYVVVKLFNIFALLSRLATKQFYHSFRLQKHSNNTNNTSSTHNNNNNFRSVTSRSNNDKDDMDDVLSSSTSVTVTPGVTPTATDISTVNDDDINTNNTSNAKVDNSNSHSIKLSACNICCYGNKFYVDSDTHTLIDNRELFIIGNCRKIFTLLLGLSGIVYGITLSSQMIAHTTDRINICEKYNNSTKGYNPEYAHLYAWPYCEFKVYPISDEIPCQCRNLVVNEHNVTNWTDDLENDPNVTSKIFESILQQFYMLETISFDAGSLIYMTELNLDDSMMTARNLKIVDFRTIQFVNISSNLGIMWSNLEFLRFHSVHGTVYSIDSWSNMKNIKWLSVELSVLTFIDVDWIFLCQLKNLNVFGISGLYSTKDVSFGDCLTNIKDLRWLNMEYVSDFDTKLLLHDGVEGINSFGNRLDIDKFETDLQKLYNETGDYLFDSIQNKSIYFQDSSTCAIFYTFENNNSITTFEAIYPLVYQLINITNACEKICRTDINSKRCRPYHFHQGMSEKTYKLKNCIIYVICTYVIYLQNYRIYRINIYTFFFLNLLFSSKFYQHCIAIKYENESSFCDLSFPYLLTIQC